MELYIVTRKFKKFNVVVQALYEEDYKQITKQLKENPTKDIVIIHKNMEILGKDLIGVLTVSNVKTKHMKYFITPLNLFTYPCFGNYDMRHNSLTESFNCIIDVLRKPPHLIIYKKWN